MADTREATIGRRSDGTNNETAHVFLAELSMDRTDRRSDATEKIQPNALENVLQIPKEQIGPGAEMAQAAAKQYLEDRAQGKDALSSGAPQFEAAIAQSDKDFQTAKTETWPAIQMALMNGAALEAQGMREMQRAKGIVGNIDGDKQQSVSAMTGMMLDKAVSPEMKETLRAELKQYPGLLESIDRMTDNAAKQSLAADALKEAQKPLMQAALETAATRMIYAKAMEMSGNTGQSVVMKGEAARAYEEAMRQLKGGEKKPLIEA